MSTTSGLSSILFAHQVDARAQGNERRAVLMLFTIPRTWKQPGCPLTDEGIKKLWCIYTMEYYSAIRRNAFGSGLMRWMYIEPFIQCEVRQKEKDIYRILKNTQNNYTKKIFMTQITTMV